MPIDPRELFRAEALEHHRAGPQLLGDPLKLLPGWIRWTYPALAGILLLAIVLAAVCRVTQFASGPSVVRVLGRRDLVAPVTALVDSILVRPGESVATGQILVRLDSSEQQVELDRAQHQFDLALANHLRDLLDASAIQAVTSLRTQLEFAKQTRDLRDLRSPCDGVVADLRSQAGQQLLPGQSALTLITSNQSTRLVGALPGRFRPFLKAGLPAWFESEGSPPERCRVRLDRVQVEVIGPNEAKRYFGADVSDAMALSGPVVMVEAMIPAPTGDRGNRTFPYHTGMQGRLQVALRSQSVLFALVPGLSTAVNHGAE